MALASRRGSRAVIAAAVLAFLLFLHVLYSGPSIPQWKTPSFLTSGSSKSDEVVGEKLPSGIPLKIYSEPAPQETKAAEPEHEYEPFTEVLTTSTQTAEATSTITHSFSSPPVSRTGSAKVPFPTYPVTSGSHGATNNKTVADLPCQSLPGGQDVLVVMRTGATEIRDKLTMHFDTTFRCYPNLLIFSDFEEVYKGHHVHDALKYIDDEIKNENPDFEHYRHIQEVGRTGLDQSELSGKLSFESGPTGKNENAGWRLDKWKFLPMANMTLALYPDMKWYVFVEPDTYLVWSNLLQWLPKLSPSKRLYMGSEVMIGDDLFAHGGSAFLMSRPALESGAHIYQERTQELNDFTAGHWAGDCVLGKALHDAGTDLTWTWPMFQGGNPNLMNYMEEKGDKSKLWCSPALSYHHFNPIEVLELFKFEQNWIQSKHLDVASTVSSEQQKPILHHSDVFSSYILPNMTTERSDWNNTSANLVPDTITFTLADCRELCESHKDCMQYSLGPAGCSMDGEAKFGRRDSGVESGWIVPRVEQWARQLSKCKGGTGWTQPTGWF